ncbi:MAG: type II toxin-antitoxin system prevent-host-death family antitoxin [Rhizomicrobium sp.]|jgi:prevent-host-death family protein
MSERYIDFNEAKEQFETLIDEAARGTDIVIEQNGRPIVRLRSALQEPVTHITKNPDSGIDLGPARDH